MDSLELLGIGSALLALTAFVGNQYGKLKNDSIWYDGLNFLSGLGLVVYATYAGVIPFIITNTVWALISGVDVVRYFLRGKRLKKGHK